jgi:spore coat protein A
MMAGVIQRLAPFVDAMPLPRRLVATEHEGRLTVRMHPGSHRFHRNLAESAIWGYDRTVPAPTIETERGQPVTVEWRNELEGSRAHFVFFRLDRGPGPSGAPPNPDPGGRRSHPTSHAVNQFRERRRAAMRKIS